MRENQNAQFMVWSDSTAGTMPSAVKIGENRPFATDQKNGYDVGRADKVISVRTTGMNEFAMKHFVFTSALVLIGAIMTGQVQGDEPKIGEPAPAFSLNGSDGKTYGLAEFKDKQAVVIAWYPKAFTGG